MFIRRLKQEHSSMGANSFTQKQVKKDIYLNECICYMKYCCTFKLNIFGYTLYKQD